MVMKTLFLRASALKFFASDNKMNWAAKNARTLLHRKTALGAAGVS